jgi:5-oxoprolinase (ATP-hydrolysing) subunit A
VSARIDVSADLGEAFGVWAMGDDAAIVPWVTSAHVACGFHAGDPRVMRRTVELVVHAGVSLGAHPSYPDLAGFGRRPMDVSAPDVADDVLYQIGALDGVARAAGARVRSVKPHGALYHRMGRDEEVAVAIAESLLSYGTGLWLVMPAGSSCIDTVRSLGVPVVTEGFCDRAYLADATLAPRGVAGSVVDQPEEVARRAVSLALEHVVQAVDGSELWLEVGTLCLHADSPGAPAMAEAVHHALEAAGVTLAPFTVTG